MNEKEKNLYMKTDELIKYIIEKLIPLNKIDLTVGRHELDGKSYYNVDIYTSKDPVICRYEAHRKYIDIQYMVEGEEYIYITDIENLQITEKYSEEKDVVFFEGGENVKPEMMVPGKYLICYPQNGHKPSVRVTESGCVVKKVVFKVKIDE